MEDHARRVSDELRVFEGEKRVPDGATDLREKPNANNHNEEEVEVTDGVDTTAVSTIHAVAHFFYPSFVCFFAAPPLQIRLMVEICTSRNNESTGCGRSQ
ncbi:unnamed protein product [Ectocarpus sp. CCAP 1310/34]|nr:unnamed protein product [Ectocarpus sp. CCAP 1310/34]